MPTPSHPDSTAPFSTRTSVALRAVEYCAWMRDSSSRWELVGLVGGGGGCSENGNCIVILRRGWGVRVYSLERGVEENGALCCLLEGHGVRYGVLCWKFLFSFVLHNRTHHHLVVSLV